METIPHFSLISAHSLVIPLLLHQFGDSPPSRLPIPKREERRGEERRGEERRLEERKGEERRGEGRRGEERGGEERRGEEGRRGEEKRGEARRGEERRGEERRGEERRESGRLRLINPPTTSRPENRKRSDDWGPSCPQFVFGFCHNALFLWANMCEYIYGHPATSASNIFSN
ncbi:hypothetical protein CBR_g25840 [Chara braunii]|uniref:Uncharacterized protein n=1 Tax=Chara braunii TaxID=69332 RepID=A0A388L6K5_CHABU|nr:hypothetical protein CBR_g25840 [Chara braunii]|eukprot:GBG77908.1 hypothetical protein CBR_g25840 [Chara braunii]